uniref:fibronectin type III domain-containing protein n=1 Tax=Algoriphagus sp. TaxID=1872435 RepID=UPI0040474030
MKKLGLMLSAVVLTTMLLVGVNGCTVSEDGVVEVVPLPPSELKATLISGEQVDLSWKDNSTNETGYKIERKTDSGNFTEIGSTATDITTFSDKTLSLNTNYTFRVYSLNQVGKSISYSNEVTIKTFNAPTLTTTAITEITASGAKSGGTVSSDGGSGITARGVVWGTSTNPTISLTTKTSDGTGVGAFQSAISGLAASTKYFVRAYATNSVGTSYGNELSFTTSATSTATFNTVVGANGRIWMDRNLGASRVATSSTDVEAYGDLYQWGRGADGHQKRTSTTTTTRSSTDVPGNASFILAPLNGSVPYDWRNPQNTNLWQGVNGINNPCPSGFRIPTEAEWNTERLSWTVNAFASPLKLPIAGGERDISNGSFRFVETNGSYWSSTVSSGASESNGSRYFSISTSSAKSGSMQVNHRGFGFSVRCIKD